MGERGNVVFLFASDGERAEPRRVYFYTHWRGDRLHEILREAMNWRETGSIRERCRWTQPEYFARVVFNRLTRGDEDGVLSFGIGVERALPDYDELHVDTVKQQIRQVRLDPVEGSEGRWEGIVEVTVASWTYEEFASGAVNATADGPSDLGVPR